MKDSYTFSLTSAQQKSFTGKVTLNICVKESAYIALALFTNKGLTGV